jgi:hypothetical protein
MKEYRRLPDGSVEYLTLYATYTSAEFDVLVARTLSAIAAVDAQIADLEPLEVPPDSPPEVVIAIDMYNADHYFVELQRLLEYKAEIEAIYALMDGV